MIIRFLTTFLLFLLIGLLERTFFAAAFPWMHFLDIVLAAAAAWMTVTEHRANTAWLLAVVFAVELLRDTPAGIAGAGVVSCIVITRVALFSVFTHRSRVARSVAAFMGIAVGMGVSTVIGLIFRVVWPANAALVPVVNLWHVAISIAVTSLVSIVLVLGMTRAAISLRRVLRLSNKGPTPYVV